MSDYRRHVGRRVLVFTAAMTFDGTLSHEGRESISMTDASALATSGEKRPVDGEVLIPKTRVDWLQVV